MLHILFLILKIIGMILLAILGILILLLSTVFFVPADYFVQAKTEDGIKGMSFEAKAHWFLHLFTVYYIYKNKHSDWQVRIGWKTFNHKDHAESTRSEKEDGNVLEEDIEPAERSDDSDGQHLKERQRRQMAAQRQILRHLKQSAKNNLGLKR